MIRNNAIFISLACTILLWNGCQKEELFPEQGTLADMGNGYLKSISDGANEGNEHFYFLAPILKDPYTTGTFDSEAQPQVVISELDIDHYPLPPIVVFTLFSDPAVSADTDCEKYYVNWHTNEYDLDPLKTYRITVKVNERVLGYADVDVVEGGNELKNVNTDEYIALKDGRTLPINFRIEKGAMMPDLLPEGLIAWYPFTGNANDMTGNGHDGSNYGAQICSDRFTSGESAFFFNGYDSYISVDSDLSGYADFSVSMWFKFEEEIEGIVNMLQTPIGDISYIKEHKWIGNNKLILRIYPDREGAASAGCSTSYYFIIDYIPDTEWHHIVYSIHADNTAGAWIDGVQLSLGERTTDNGVVHNWNATMIGANKNSDTQEVQRFYPGALDDIRLYNRVLGNPEVGILFHEGGWR